MLILTRKPGESLYIGDDIKITIVELKGHQIRVGINAPPELRIYREEIYLQILEENRMAAEATQSVDVNLDTLSAALSAPGASAQGPEDPSAGPKPEAAEAKPRIRSLGAATQAGEQVRVQGIATLGAARPKSRDPEVLVKRKRINKTPDE